VEKIGINNTAMAIVVIATAVVIIGGLAVVPTMQEVYGDHTARPNPSETGIENGGETHGGGLSDHGCQTSSTHQQGRLNSGGECQHESVVE
jgi:hypothetical protein